MLVPAAKVVIPLLQPRLEVSRPLVAECEALLERLQLPDVLVDTRGVYPLMQAKQLDENRLAYAMLKERVEAYVARCQWRSKSVPPGRSKSVPVGTRWFDVVLAEVRSGAARQQA
jgi:hypothetical protein